MREIRQYVFAGIRNFRDFGGVACRSGRLDNGRLFRSGHLAEATAADMATLQTLDLRTIIDLRRPSERMRQPTPSGLSAQIISSDVGDRGEAPHLEFLRQGDTSDSAVENFLLSYYRAAPFEPRHVTLFAQSFAVLQDGPLLIHCTAGKDRTGLLAALILTAAGVNHDDVLADFLETNTAMLTPGNIDRMIEVARRALGRDPSPKVIHAICGVDARHLEAAFAAIRARSGNVETYLAQVLSANPA